MSNSTLLSDLITQALQRLERIERLLEQSSRLPADITAAILEGPDAMVVRNRAAGNGRRRKK